MLFREVLEHLGATEKNVAALRYISGNAEDEPKRDLVKQDDFNDTSLTEIRNRVGDNPFVDFR